MRQTQQGASRAPLATNSREWLHLPRPPVFQWGVTSAKFDEEITRIRRSETCTKAIECIVGTIQESYFAPFRFDRAVGFASASETLTYLAYAVVRRAAPKRASYEMHWLIDEEKEKPTPAVAASRMKFLARLPGRIEEMAEEIERVNAWPLFISEGRHAKMPTAMRQYAEILRARVKRKPTYAKPILYLVETVFLWTGKTQPSKLARLLAEVAGVLEVSPPYSAQEISDVLPSRKGTRKI